MRELRWTVDGTELRAWDGGGARDRVVVMLHPTPLDHRFWLPVADQLGGWRCVLADLRGHGESGLGVEAVTIAQLGRDAEGLLRTLGVSTAVWVGCSIGGYTLYELWRQMPERVRALAWFAAKPHPDGEHNRTWRQGWMETMQARFDEGENGPGEGFVAAMVELGFAAGVQRERPAEVEAWRHVIRRAQPAQVLAVQKGLGARPDSRATATTVTVPSLVVAGEEDRASTPAEMHELALYLRQGGAPVEEHVLPGAGHFGAWEQPGRVAALLGEWLGRLPSTAQPAW